MNRYAAVGLMLDALAGKEIIILSETHRASHEAMEYFTPILPDTATISRVNGRERVTFPRGGRLRFQSARSAGMRGQSADVVFLDGGVEHSLNVLQDAHLVTLTTHGETIRA